MAESQAQALAAPLSLFQGKEHWPRWLKTWVCSPAFPETVGCEISDAYSYRILVYWDFNVWGSALGLTTQMQSVLQCFFTIFRTKHKLLTPRPQHDSLMFLHLTLSVWNSVTESQTLATDPALFNNLCFLLCFIVEPHPTANGSHLFAFTLAAPSIWVTRPLLHLTLSTLSLEQQSNLISSGEAILPAWCPVTAHVAWLGQCPDTSLVPPWACECLQDWTMALPISVHLHLVLRHLKYVVLSKYFPEWMTDWMNDSINYKVVVPLSRNQFPHL